MKRPSESIKEMFLDILEKDNESNLMVFQNLDKLMTWLVGFAIAGFSLLLTKVSDDIDFLTKRYIYIVLLLLAISTISGILFRLAFYLYQSEYRKVVLFLNLKFKEREFMNVTNNIESVKSVSELKKIFEEDFGEDITPYIEIENLTKSTEEIKLERLKIYYNETKKWASDDYNHAMEYVVESFAEGLGLNERQKKNFREDKFIPKKYKFYMNLYIILLVVGILSFISALLLVLIAY